MSEYDLHSLILACDFRVDNVDRMWKWLTKHKDGLRSMGAHHVVLYTSIWEPRRVLVTIGIRQAKSIREVIRSPAVFEWFDISGADDIHRYLVARWSRKLTSAGRRRKSTWDESWSA